MFLNVRCATHPPTTPTSTPLLYYIKGQNASCIGTECWDKSCAAESSGVNITPGDTVLVKPLCTQTQAVEVLCLLIYNSNVRSGMYIKPNLGLKSLKTIHLCEGTGLWL